MYVLLPFITEMHVSDLAGHLLCSLKSRISLSKYVSVVNNLYYEGANCSFKVVIANHLLFAAV